MRYRYLLFDADGTLFDFNAAEKASLQQTLEQFGVTWNDAVLETYSRINLACWDSLERGETTAAEMQVRRFGELFRELGVAADAEACNRAYLYGFRHFPHLIQGAEELCMALSQEGYELSIITNGLALSQHARLENSALAPYIGHIFISEELNVWKPDPGYFDAVLSSLGVEDRSQVLVIGDSLSADIRGGNDSGIDTCWFNPGGKQADGMIRPTYEISTLAGLKEIL